MPGKSISDRSGGVTVRANRDAGCTILTGLPQAVTARRCVCRRVRASMRIAMRGASASPAFYQHSTIMRSERRENCSQTGSRHAGGVDRLAGAMAPRPRRELLDHWKIEVRRSMGGGAPAL